MRKGKSTIACSLLLTASYSAGFQMKQVEKGHFARDTLSFGETSTKQTLWKAVQPAVEHLITQEYFKNCLLLVTACI